MDGGDEVMMWVRWHCVERRWCLMMMAMLRYRRERWGDEMEMMKMVEEAGEGFRVWGSWLNIKKRKEKARGEIRGG